MNLLTQTPDMNPIACFILLAALLLSTPNLSLSARPDSSKPKAKVGGNDGDPSGFFAQGGGFGIPWVGKGWGNGIVGGGYGSGYGGPSGGHSKSGVIRPTVVCKEKGRCYKRKVICPAKCFTSYSRSGKNYGAGGGGGGCTIDCKKKCIAYC